MKQLVIIIFFLTSSLGGYAQIDLQITLLGDGETYLVSITPDKTWLPPLNSVGSSQISLQCDRWEDLNPVNVKSYVPGANWELSAVIKNTGSDFDYFCFALQEKGTKAIEFQSGYQLPLFSFQSSKSFCAETLSIIENEDEQVAKLFNESRINVKNNLTVLAARGNADLRPKASEFTCQEEFSDEFQLNVFPNPAYEAITFSWKAGENYFPVDMEIFDPVGRIVHTQRLPEGIGSHMLRIDLGAQAYGVYCSHFKMNDGSTEKTCFVKAN